jgi:carbon monoxide dehydrogenase subunit G
MNTKLIKAIIGLTIVMLFASACNVVPTFGSRNIITESRQVSGYTQVEVSGAGSLVIIQDGTEALTIETDDNIMPYVTSEVRGGNLSIGLDSKSGPFSPSKMDITLHVKELSNITTSGSWDVTCALLQADSLTILTSGTSNATIDSLSVGSLKVTISGTGNLELAGMAEDQSVEISGSGKYLAGDLQSTTATITVSGSGNGTVWATGELDVHISGSGDIGYYGDPQVAFNQSGSGSIHGLGAK